MGDTQTTKLLGVEVPRGNDPASIYRRIRALERLMERSMTIPGVKVPIGLDAIVGLVPVVGDFVGVALGSYILWEARNLGMSRFHLARMAGNLAVDGAIGVVPLVGDAFDLAFRANTRNLRIVKRHMRKHHPDVAVVDL